MRNTVMLLNSSQEMCGDEPTPAEATVKLSGSAFAVAISSGTERAENEGCTTSTCGPSITPATGAKSRVKLNFRSL